VGEERYKDMIGLVEGKFSHFSICGFFENVGGLCHYIKKKKIKVLHDKYKHQMASLRRPPTRIHETIHDKNNNNDQLAKGHVQKD
jgi:hypothetical protein